MSGDQTRPVDVELVLGLFRQARDEVTDMVHANRGDDRREVRDALLHVAFRLEVLERDLGVRLGVNEAEPGVVTADVVRRMRTNSGRHRSGT